MAIFQRSNDNDPDAAAAAQWLESNQLNQLVRQTLLGLRRLPVGLMIPVSVLLMLERGVSLAMIVGAVVLAVAAPFYLVRAVKAPIHGGVSV